MPMPSPAAIGNSVAKVWMPSASTRVTGSDVATPVCPRRTRSRMVRLPSWLLATTETPMLVTTPLAGEVRPAVEAPSSGARLA